MGPAMTLSRRNYIKVIGAGVNLVAAVGAAIAGAAPRCHAGGRCRGLERAAVGRARPAPAGACPRAAGTQPAHLQSSAMSTCAGTARCLFVDGGALAAAD